MTRHKGKIIAIGTLNEEGFPIGWVFDGQGQGVAIDIDENGKWYYCGYSREDLRVIYEKHKAP